MFNISTFHNRSGLTDRLRTVLCKCVIHVHNNLKLKQPLKRVFFISRILVYTHTIFVTRTGYENIRANVSNTCDTYVLQLQKRCCV